MATPKTTTRKPRKGPVDIPPPAGGASGQAQPAEKVVLHVQSTSSTHSARSSNTLVVASANLKEAARRALLQTEVHLLVGVKPAEPSQPPMSRWFGGRQSVHASPGFIRRPTARYRMPRRVKQSLIERFCAVTDPLTVQTPSVMIVVAHQDDESIGAGSRLSKLTDPYVVHVTDGAPRNPEVARRYGFSSREEYAEARRTEAVRAMEVAGIPEDHLICLDYVDGEASLQMVDLVVDVARLIDELSPDIVITHPYEGGHTDHDSTAFAVHLACGLLRREGVEPPVVLEMTSYHASSGMRVVHEFLPHERADIDRQLVELSEEDQDLKRQMYDCFSSQQNIMTTFTTAIEKFRPAPRYVFTEAPHEGQLNYERYGDPTRGERWRRDAAEALEQLKLRKSS